MQNVQASLVHNVLVLFVHNVQISFVQNVQVSFVQNLQIIYTKCTTIKFCATSQQVMRIRLFQENGSFLISPKALILY